MLGKDFRAGVGAVIISDQGLIFAGERQGEPGNWQMPQGGLDAREAPLTGVLREIQEETGIVPDDLVLMEEFPGWLAYELPTDIFMRRTYRGQVQKWFLFKFTGDASAIDLAKATDQEFRAWQWMRAADLLDNIIEFKRPVYRQLFQRFGGYLNIENVVN